MDSEMQAVTRSERVLDLNGQGDAGCNKKREGGCCRPKWTVRYRL